MDELRDIKITANKRAGDMTEILAVEPNLRVVIDAVKLEGEMAARKILRQREHCPVPVILFIQAVGNQAVVQAIIWVRIDSLVHEGRQNGAGNSRIIPISCVH